MLFSDASQSLTEDEKKMTKNGGKCRIESRRLTKTGLQRGLRACHIARRRITECAKKKERKKKKTKQLSAADEVDERTSAAVGVESSTSLQTTSLKAEQPYKGGSRLESLRQLPALSGIRSLLLSLYSLLV